MVMGKRVGKLRSLSNTIIKFGEKSRHIFPCFRFLNSKVAEFENSWDYFRDYSSVHTEITL